MKEWTGIEDPNDPEYIKRKATKMNAEQAQMKHEMQRELTENNKHASPIQLKKEHVQDLQSQRKEQMQSELTNENKVIPPFDEKSTTVEKMKETWDKTTTKIAEKSEIAMEKVKEWTGAKDGKENLQEIKDKAVKMNPEQAQMKQKMQKELTQINKNENQQSNHSHQKERKLASDEKDFEDCKSSTVADAAKRKYTI